FVAYYGTILAERFGLDPDTYGIPLVTSVMDLVGALTLVAALAALAVL
ncbi:MAG: magnesium transporter, partial [Acidimicrobiia bacterium]|nr:magnesium transporter [Acidimicrobiia bacterium]